MFAVYNYSLDTADKVTGWLVKKLIPSILFYYFYKKNKIYGNAQRIQRVCHQRKYS